MVDAAHSIGQYPHSVQDWNCDFYGTSLHKWFSGPLGTGLLYVKKELIAGLRGNYATSSRITDHMSKFEHAGTISFAHKAALLGAIQFQQSLGIEAKFERLKSLTDYWTSQGAINPRIKIIKPAQYGALASFESEKESTEVLAHFKAKKIHLKKVRAANQNTTRYRVSPNIFHNFKDLDKFVETLIDL